MEFLPITRREMLDRGWDVCDFVYIIGDAYVDHPSFGHAIISRVLESHGYNVGIISQPDWKNPKSIDVFGRPRLGFLVSGGNMDSMVNHYSVTKHHRKTDAFTPGGIMGKRPDYATTVYCNLIRQTYKDVPILIGGIEASLRRLGHYDYWSDTMKRSILLDSQADLLMYGMGEKTIVEVADALNSGLDVKDITYIDGTVFKTKAPDDSLPTITLPSFAEIKALCAGDPRIKERMDLDVEVAKLKLMKADHQSKQYRLEDQLLKYFPEEIEKHKGFIKGFESDLEVLAAHPHPEDGFAGMEIRGDLLTDKENAGAALLDACKEVKTSDPVQIGSYRGYAISVEFSAWKQEYTLLLKGQMTHRATLGTDPRGNLTRIDNALAQMPQRLESAKAQLDNLCQQQAAAKEEVGKPFLYEEELRCKNARLVELDTLLNIDGKGQAHTESVVAKSTRPSVLDNLKRPVQPRSTDKKPKQHEEVR